MKNNLLFKFLLFAFFLVFSGIFNESKAQVVFPREKEKKSNPDVFFPNRKRTAPVIVRNGNRSHLPPGQEKKIYGDRSAREYAPGHQKKNKYYKNGKYRNRKQSRYNQYGNNDDDRENRNRGEHEGHRNEGRHDD